MPQALDVWMGICGFFTSQKSKLSVGTAICLQYALSSWGVKLDYSPLIRSFIWGIRVSRYVYVGVTGWPRPCSSTDIVFSAQHRDHMTGTWLAVSDLGFSPCMLPQEAECRLPEGFLRLFRGMILRRSEDRGISIVNITIRPARIGRFPCLMACPRMRCFSSSGLPVLRRP